MYAVFEDAVQQVDSSEFTVEQLGKLVHILREARDRKETSPEVVAAELESADPALKGFAQWLRENAGVGSMFAAYLAILLTIILQLSKPEKTCAPSVSREEVQDMISLSIEEQYAETKRKLRNKKKRRKKDEKKRPRKKK